MTPTTLAETILRDVPKSIDGTGVWLDYGDVLAALSRALDPVLTERAGEVLEGVTDGTWDFFQGADNADKAYFGVTAPSGDICQMSNAQAWRGKQTIANARFIAWCREGVPALLAQNAALRAERAFTATDGGRLLRKSDVAGVCDSPDLCFVQGSSTVRCSPCAAKIAARDGVQLNPYTHGNPQANRLRRQLTAAEAKVEKLRDDLQYARSEAKDAATLVKWCCDAFAEKLTEAELYQLRRVWEFADAAARITEADNG